MASQSAQRLSKCSSISVKGHRYISGMWWHKPKALSRSFLRCSASSIHSKLKKECQKALQSWTGSSNPPPHELHLEPGQYTVSTHHPHNEEKTCKWQISEALTGRKLSEVPLVNLQHRPHNFDVTKCYAYKNAIWSTAHRLLQLDTWSDTERMQPIP